MAKNKRVFDYSTGLKIKRMYLKMEMRPLDIANKLNKSLKKGQKPYGNQAIAQWCSTNGLVKQRKEMRMQVTNLIESSESNHVRSISEFNEEVSERSRLLTMKGMDGMEDATEGKDFSGFANGASKMFDMFRKAEGLDSQIVTHLHSDLKRVYAEPTEAPKQLPGSSNGPKVIDVETESISIANETDKAKTA